MERPGSLQRVIETAEALARSGAAPWSAPGVPWLVGIGVAEEWERVVLTNENWASSALPAKNERDLLRHLAFRDPGYRAYLDDLLAQVLRAMAQAGRVDRVEQLLFDHLSGFGPRLSLTLRRAQKSGRLYEGSTALTGDFDEVRLFQRWDRELWGDIPGGPEQKFPALMQHYGPAVLSPVWLRADLWGLSSLAAALLAEAILAGEDGRLVVFPSEFGQAWSELESLGLPIRRWDDPSDRGLGCIGEICLVLPQRSAPLGLVRRDSPIELPKEVMRGTVSIDVREGRATNLWSAADGDGRIGAYPGLDLAAPEWPSSTEAIATAPGRLALPAHGELERRVPTAIRALAADPLFGLLLQLFFAEAFGRELGDPQITVLEGGPRGTPARLDVYFRPPTELGPLDRPSRRLGTLDEVMTDVAEAFGIYTVPYVYDPPPRDAPWTAAVRLLIQVGVAAVGTGEISREVVIDVTFFDACHNTELLQEVVRPGGSIRHDLRQRLRQRWEALPGLTDSGAPIHG